VDQKDTMLDYFTRMKDAIENASMPGKTLIIGGNRVGKSWAQSVLQKTAAAISPIPNFSKVDRFDLSRWMSRAGWLTMEELLAGKDPEKLGFGARVNLAIAMGAEESTHGTGTRWSIDFRTEGDKITLRQSTPAASAWNFGIVYLTKQKG